MSLDLGELSIALDLDKDQFSRGLTVAKTELQTLPATAQREMASVSREMDKGGKDAGGKLAQGINAGVIRNSPLIVAGVTGALAAGAPAVLLGAGALFAGIGAVAAAQSDKVQSTWVGAWDHIRVAAIDDAGVLEDTFVNMAAQVTTAFDGLRPQIQKAFGDSGPLVDKFTAGVVDLARNAMPGLVSAVGNAGPAFDGLQSLLGAVGTGLGEFFGIISDHSTEAGTAFAAFGDIVGNLLPVLGELLGSGADLATIVLPPLAAGVGALADAAGMLGPLLPAIALGLAGMKVAGAVTTGISGLSTGLAKVAQNAAQASYDVDGFAGRAAGKASDAASRTGRAFSTMSDNIGKASIALPAIGMVIAGITSDLADASNEEDRWAQAILAGGQASTQAFAEYQSGTHWGQAIDEATNLSSSWNDASKKADEMRASMTPLQRAQADATAAQNELTAVVDKYGPSSDQARSASQRYRDAQADVEEQSGRTELALHGVTDAMVDQANQALAAIDSGFAYQQSLYDLSDAIVSQQELEKSGTATAGDLGKAQLDVEQANLRVAEAYGKQQADLSGLSTDTAEYTRLLQNNTLQELYRLRDTAGPEMAGALQQQIDMLEAAGVSLGETGVAAGAVSDRMKDLGVKVTQVPGYKGVYIDAPTADQQARIEALGYKVVTLPNGRIYVAADVADASARIAGIQAQINALHDRTVTITTRSATVQAPGVQGMGRAAVGGNVGERARGFSAGGRLSGPGGPTADLIPAATFSGRSLMLSDDEWVIKARSAAMYGDRAMAAVNAGTATIGYAGGGQVSAPPTSGGGTTLTGGPGPLLNVETLNLLEGTPRDVADELAIKLRTGG